MIGPIRYINASFSFNGLKGVLIHVYLILTKLEVAFRYWNISTILAYLVLGKPKDIKSNAIKLVVVLISKLVFYYHMRIHTLFYIQAFLIMKK